jgi:Flp pilus assembly protein protease CpaA
VPDVWIVLACAWLAVCAVQDWRRRQVSNLLTLSPLALGLFLRLVGVVQGPVSPLLIVGLTLLLTWRKGWLGGADFKACLALALLDLRLLAWAWAGLGLWYALLSLVYLGEDVKRLPGFVGFTTGAVVYLFWSVSHG